MLLFLILLSSILPLQLKSFFHAEVAEPEVKPPCLQPPKCKAFSVKWQSVLLLQSGTAEREKSYLHGFIKYHKSHYGNTFFLPLFTEDASSLLLQYSKTQQTTQKTISTSIKVHLTLSWLWSPKTKNVNNFTNTTSQRPTDSSLFQKNSLFKSN